MIWLSGSAAEWYLVTAGSNRGIQPLLPFPPLPPIPGNPGLDHPERRHRLDQRREPLLVPDP